MRLKEAAIGNTQRENVHYRTPSGGNRAGDLFEDNSRRRAHHKQTPAQRIAGGQAPLDGFGFTTPAPSETPTPPKARSLDNQAPSPDFVYGDSTRRLTRDEIDEAQRFGKEAAARLRTPVSESTIRIPVKNMDYRMTRDHKNGRLLITDEGLRYKAVQEGRQWYWEYVD